MLNVIMLIVFVLGGIMLNVVVLLVFMLTVIITERQYVE